MKTTQQSEVYLNFLRSAARSIVWIATSIAMTIGICSAASPVRVSCALPYSSGQSSPGCTGQHTVVITTTNTDSNAKVTAELMGLDVNGTLIKSLLVNNGDNVQMQSILQPGGWKFDQNKNKTTVYAPVPLLHVKVEDKGETAEAFCSDIPYVQMILPTGGVVTDSSANTNVLAAVPMTNVNDLHLYVDGVDLLAQVPNYQTCSAFAPCSGTANINGDPVSYSNLIVDVASGITVPASNTIQVALTSLTCGGHIFNVSASKAPQFPTTVSSSCNVDSLSKKATSSIFAISITDPTPLKVTPFVPTPVAGEVCSGTQITDVNINGKVLSVAGQTFAPGNGTTSGDVYKVQINTTLDKTDLVRDAFGTHDAPLGTFDSGSNRLAAAAKEIKGNRTFKNVIFATGSVAPVGIDPNAKIFQSAAIQHAVNSHLENLVQAKIAKVMNAPASTDLQNAFVVGLSASGAQTMFNKLCTAPIQGSADPTINGLTPGQAFKKKVTQAVQAIPLAGHNGVPQLSIPSPCSCDPPVNLNLASVTVGTDVSCNVTFHDTYFHVSMGLPSVSVAVDAIGFCKETLLDACVDGAAVGIEATASITGIKFDFDVTEANLKNNTVDPAPVYFKGTTATGAHDIENPFGDQGISTCGLSDVCVFLVQVFTFGAVDLTPSIDISNVQDFSGQIGASQPDPVKLKQIKVDPTVVASFDQSTSGIVSDVRITPNGITAGLKGTFASLAVDPSVPATPGITLTPAPIPTLPVPNAKDVFIGISDDAINMMFASLTAAGKLQTGSPNGNGCVDTGATVGSLLPASCDSLDLGNDVATVAARGYCHAIKGDVCSSITYNNPALSAADNANLTASEQGECFGAQGLPAGQTCSSLTSSVAQGNLFFFGACSITPSFNLKANQPLLFCAKGDVPPRMLFPDTNVSGGSVPAVLRIPSLSVELVIDRTGDHQVPGALADIPGCFAQGTSTAVDCNVFSSCLSINLDFDMKFQTCVQDNKPGFLPTFKNIQILNRSVGTVCGGATSPTTDTNVLSQSSSDQITIPLGQNGAGFAPPICGAGLDLGGFVTCASPGVLSIRTENTFTESRDYLAITCAVQ